MVCLLKRSALFLKCLGMLVKWSFMLPFVCRIIEGNLTLQLRYPQTDEALLTSNIIFTNSFN